LVLGCHRCKRDLAVASALGFVATSFVVPILAKRIRPAYLIAGGWRWSPRSFALLSASGGPNSLAFIVRRHRRNLARLGRCSSSPRLIVSAAPPERAGAAAAISETGAEFGGVLGIAIPRQHRHCGLSEHDGPRRAAGLSAESAEAARDTLGGALAVGGQLAGPGRRGADRSRARRFLGGVRNHRRALHGDFGGGRADGRVLCGGCGPEGSRARRRDAAPAVASG
jgi:DHA2 family multidrug resistance protein-like MFS transporter